ncbi:MAG: GNAT family N-acetyltransferase [Emcibacter sp.]|nr:GNAT family N-acetyltransferase [Emcibacter sp.]
MSGLQSRIIKSLSDISENDWNACCFNEHTGHNPFLSYAFMNALEKSGSATAKTGWMAQHIIAHQGVEIIGIMPLYLKNHSQGEYVFDHSWANAYHAAGGQYYPKLQSSVPFTPVTSPRLLVRPDQDTRKIQEYLLDAAIVHAENLGVSSLHVTFPEKNEWELMNEKSFLKRLDQQYHWVNQDYCSFDDFLMALSSRKRRNIRKERKQAVSDNIDIEILSGNDITEHHWDHYFSFYLDTANRKWGQPYLNRLFFSLLGEKISDRIVLIMCKRQNRYIAGALNLLSDDTLYGRYWGAIEDHRYLHFEICYYQAIEYAIKHGLKKVEAGAQGEHKLARGYMPTPTYSNHWIQNTSFRDAVSHYLDHEKEIVAQNTEILSSLAPFKKT